MTVNLLKKIHEKIDDRLVGQIGTVLGENEDRTRAGINAAVPTLLRGVMGVASTEQGTQMVERELDPFDDGIIHDYGKQLEFEKSRKLVDEGSDLVQAFFGNATVRTMAIVSRESGLGASKCRSLTGMLMPLVLGVVGEQRKKQNLDTAGFQSLLAEQNDYIANKVPNGVCAALNLPKLEKHPFYPPQTTKPTLTPYRPSATAGAGRAAISQPGGVRKNPPTEIGHQATKQSPATTVSTDVTTEVGNSNGFSTSHVTPSPQRMQWAWGILLPLILLLGLLGWFFSRSNHSDSLTETTPQADNVKQIADLPSWDEETTPPPFDTSSMLNSDIPAIAPSFEEIDDEPTETVTGEVTLATDVETTDVETTDVETTDVQATDVETTDVETTEKETAEKETTGKEHGDQNQNSEVSESSDGLKNDGPQNDGPQNEAAEESEAASDNNAAPNKAATSELQSLELPTSDVQTGNESGPRNAARNRSALATTIAATSLATAPTVTTAINRPRHTEQLTPSLTSFDPNDTTGNSQGREEASPNSSPSASNGGSASHVVAPTVAPTVAPSVADISPDSDDTERLANRFCQITQGVTDALQRIDNAEDAQNASQIVNRLSNDVYELTPQIQAINGTLRQELNAQTNAFATDIEALYDAQVDNDREKIILLPTLIVLMQRIEATLNS